MRRVIVVLTVLLAAGEARAAGGALAVDDAAVDAAYHQDENANWLTLGLTTRF